MEKAIRRYWPVFVLPTLIAFIIGFVWPFMQVHHRQKCAVCGLKQLRNDLVG